jgi:hypothetical protein
LNGASILKTGQHPLLRLMKEPAVVMSLPAFDARTPIGAVRKPNHRGHRCLTPAINTPRQYLGMIGQVHSPDCGTRLAFHPHDSLKRMTPDPVIKVVLQRHDWDCGVACLAMLTGVSYEETLAALARVGHVERGLWFWEIEKAAEELGVPVKRLRSKRFDLSTTTGILSVEHLKNRHSHVCFLWNGRVIETDGTIWEEVGTYLATKNYKACAAIIKE